MMIKIVFYIIFCNCAIKFGHASITEDIYDKFQQNEYKVKFERGDVSYVNNSLARVSVTTFPYNRTMRATNVTFVLYHDYKKSDIKVEFQAYKFLSNEYRLFPMHFQMDLCRALEENIAGTSSGFKCGNLTSCPFKKNTIYFTCNNVMDETRYPPLIPSGQYKIEMTIFAKPHTLLFRANTYIIIYRTLKPGQSGRD